MRSAVSRKMIITISAAFLIFITAAVVLFPHIKKLLKITGISNHGRLITISYPELFTIQAPPPRLKLISYMNSKYGISFKEYKGEEYLFSEQTSEHHTDAEGYDFWCNGILVETESYPNHYFFVCDEYGDCKDDFYLHAVHNEMENALHSTLDDAIDGNFKIVCMPLWNQNENLSDKSELEDILKRGRYEIRIYIEGDGENCSADFEQIKASLSPYWTPYNDLRIYYCDAETIAAVNSDELVFGPPDADNFSFYKYGAMRFYVESEIRWYDGQSE